MGASTGTGLYPGSSTFPGALVFPGQGTQPIMRCLISYSDIATSTSATSPVWLDVTTDLRAVSTDRGANSEFAEIDTGTATVALDNRTRKYDPITNGSIRPMNRIWLYEEFGGDTEDVFKGYVEAWQQTWPAPGGVADAVAVASCSDEFLPLGLEELPTTSPPRTSYAELVTFDQPQGYWGFNDFIETVQQTDLNASYNVDYPIGAEFKDGGATSWLRHHKRRRGRF